MSNSFYRLGGIYSITNKIVNSQTNNGTIILQDSCKNSK